MAHILIVDDDAQIRLSFSNFISKMGHESGTAANGTEALRYLDMHHVDLILLDIIMPELDGIATILEINKSPERPAVIAISGGSRSLDTDFIQTVTSALKVDIFLHKPVNLDELKIAIEEILSSLSNTKV